MKKYIFSKKPGSGTFLKCRLCRKTVESGTQVMDIGEIYLNVHGICHKECAVRLARQILDDEN